MMGIWVEPGVKLRGKPWVWCSREEGVWAMRTPKEGGEATAFRQAFEDVDVGANRTLAHCSQNLAHLVSTCPVFPLPGLRMAKRILNRCSEACLNMNIQIWELLRLEFKISHAKNISMQHTPGPA